MSIANLHQSTKLALNLMNIAEEMLFSINLKPEIVRKYETMRENVFDKLGISNDFYKYWELQNRAKDLADNKKLIHEREKKLMKTNLEEAQGHLSRTLVTFNYLINNLKSSLEGAGKMDCSILSKSSISIDVFNYPSELTKFESEITNLINNMRISEKELSKLTEKVNSLTQENQTLSVQIENMQETYEESLQKVENNYQLKLQQILNHNLNDSKKFTDLEMSFQEKETQLIGQLDKLTNEDASVLKHLREKLEKLQTKNQDLRNVLKSVSERTSIIFNEFVDKEEILDHLTQRRDEISDRSENKTWQYYSDMLAEMDFIGYSLHKLQGDNDWLIEQLDSFCRENEELKQKISSGPKKLRMQKVFTSLTSNDVVVKDFNEARKQLLSQFKDNPKNID